MRTRFAPSPTGLLHLGNMRTALFNYLLARGAHGAFLLRIEDTDAMRGHEKYAQALMQDLEWLELRWDEGPERGGPAGPYAQSQRGAIYDKYFAELEASGLAYPCFCTEHELKVERKTQLASGQPPSYSGKCRRLSAEEVEERRARGLAATLRFRVADDRTVEFEDRVRGPQRFASADIGDFVIRRSDGTPAFFFCNAVDDALMGVTLVLRGEDHLTNTPRQLLLLEALKLAAPAYAHIPLVVGADGAPLSKRTGSKSLQELRDAGFLPLAIDNYLARVGHTYNDNRLLPLSDLAAQFDLARVHHSPARFDEAQLLHWQREAVRHKSVNEIWRWMGEDVHRLVPQEKRDPFVASMQGIITFPREAEEWARILFESEVVQVTNRDAREVLEAAPPGFSFKGFLAGMDSIGWNATRFGSEFPLDRTPKSSFPRVRAALTNRMRGPEMWRLLDLLGEHRVRARLNAAETMLGSRTKSERHDDSSR